MDQELYRAVGWLLPQWLASSRGSWPPVPTDGGGTSLDLFCLQTWRKSKIRFRQFMRVYVKNNSAKFYPDPIWNNRALGFEEWTEDYRLLIRWPVSANTPGSHFTYS